MFSRGGRASKRLFLLSALGVEISQPEVPVQKEGAKVSETEQTRRPAEFDESY